jgi:hypothetical protein
VQRFRVEFALVTLVVLLASPTFCAAQHAGISGVVRDRTGTAQLGVLVEIAAANSAIVGRAFTDLRGHYLVNDLIPGNYRIQATAAMYAPALRANLQLHAGARAIVNLTMTALYDTTAWLPAERRKADEPGDDWMWTLRSATNRPILRMVENGDLVMVSSSAMEGSHTPSTRGKATVTSGDGGFGDGGLHNVVTIDKAQEDGSRIVLRADTGAGRAQYGVGPSMELSSGFERQTGFASTTRSVASVQSHPELISAGHVTGMQMMELTTAQHTKLGDLVDLEVGGNVYSVHTSGYAFVPQPFIRVVVESAEGWSFGYRMATSREIQGFSALNDV